MTFDSTSQLVIAAGVATSFMFGLWLIQLVTRDAGIVDVGWSGTLGLIAIFYGFTLTDRSSRSWLVMLLAAVWSFRLATHLLRDRVIGKAEDGRYRNLREALGNLVLPFFLVFFQIQALLAWLFSLAFWLAMQRQGPLDWSDAVGCIIWGVSLAGESIADEQLARFRVDPKNKGKTCRQGIWRYSRHPNYFFEWTYWWSYVLFAWNTEMGWIAVFAPLVMLVFLFKVTGIPAMEAQALLSRGDDYRDYQMSTSVFVPWFPKTAK
jgi:steroid 5-alpha reductase family enzyme